ncbi:MAG: haloacid dehalogenase [Microbacteriaceae bacterium]|nr:haloacid dehalogenase [Microbacteriaceae bacterium]
MPDQIPLSGVDLLLADLDGVVYKGKDAIPFAVESINRAGQQMRVGYLTNNASRTPESVASQLSSLGLDVSAEDIVTSPQAAVRLLAGLVPAGSTILVIGGEGLVSEVAHAGFVVCDSALEAPAAVIQGYFPEIGWKHLAEASFALNDAPDIPWVATNTDWTIPVARGIAPGNGTLVSAVHTAVGRLPVVAGKPEVAIFEEATARFGGTHPLFIGDRLDTDILGANRAGMESVLVLTGVDGPKQVLAADDKSRPTYIVGDLRQLHEPYPATVEMTDGDARLFAVGSSTVRLQGNAVTVDRAGDAIDLVRAGAAAIWGSGIAIYGLEVDPGLYSTSSV